MVSASIHRIDPVQRAVAMALLVLALCSPGCGSSGHDLSSGLQGTAKARTEEERYRYEGKGRVKQKTLIRRQDERFKELLEAAKKKG